MRASGILMHITSLPSEYGVGTMGREAYNFIDFLKEAGQSYWQVLPIGPTGYGDSPYQSFSAFAGNPYFIDLELLEEEGLLSKEEYSGCDFGSVDSEVDYGKLYENRMPIISLAASRVKEGAEYLEFCEKNAFWLDSYALYTAIKASLDGIAITKWPSELRYFGSEAALSLRDRFKDEISTVKKTQFLFDKQWSALKKYANESGIKIIGDIPIYVSPDGADLFAYPECFMLDADLKPTEVAGCPPDAFSEDGQLWGNPLYNWKYLDSTGYEWWIKRIESSFRFFDVVRIDHFRGFESFYCIPYGAKSAVKGRWRKGPGMKLFKAIKEKLGDLDIIAEDLGTITPPVRKLLKDTGYPGMKVLQFAFSPDSESEYLPHHHIENCVLYTGTHDNNTTRGWLESADEDEARYASEYMNLSAFPENKAWGVVRAAMQSPAKLCIIPMQDFINADGKARMNTPSTLGGNWVWRIEKGFINSWLSSVIRELTVLFSRCEKEEIETEENEEI